MIEQEPNKRLGRILESAEAGHPSGGLYHPAGESAMKGASFEKGGPPSGQSRKPSVVCSAVKTPPSDLCRWFTPTGAEQFHASGRLHCNLQIGQVLIRLLPHTGQGRDS